MVTLVVFAIPMAIYMEYRGKTEEFLSRRKRKGTHPAEIHRTATEEPDATVQPPALPQEFPDALKSVRV